MRTYKIINVDTGDIFTQGIHSQKLAEERASYQHERNGESYVVIETETKTVFRTPEARAA